MLLTHFTDEALTGTYLALVHVFLRLCAGSLEDGSDFLQREQIAHRVQMNALVEMLTGMEFFEEFLVTWLGHARTGGQVGDTVLELHAQVLDLGENGHGLVKLLVVLLNVEDTLMEAQLKNGFGTATHGIETHVERSNGFRWYVRCFEGVAPRTVQFTVVIAPTSRCVAWQAEGCLAAIASIVLTFECRMRKFYERRDECGV